MKPDLFNSTGLWIILAVLCCPGCEPQSGVSDAELAARGRLDSTGDPDLNPIPTRVAVTVGMVADLIRRIGADRVDLRQIMGSGVDPHLYRPTRDDVRLLMIADAVFYSGLMLEGRLTDTLSRIGRKKPVVAVTELIPQDQLLHSDDDNDHWDPHVWMDVSAWSTCVAVITDQLIQLDPEGETDFRHRAALLKKELDELHQYGIRCIDSIPQEQRVLITSHDAFSYLGRAYGIQVTGVQGLSTESEAGLRRINELVDLLVERRISAVFVESSVPRKNILALIDGARSRGQTVEIGGELFSDAMGKEGTWEGTYSGMMDHNFTLISRSLGGTAPDRGLYGRLQPVH